MREKMDTSTLSNEGFLKDFFAYLFNLLLTEELTFKSYILLYSVPLQPLRGSEDNCCSCLKDLEPYCPPAAHILWKLDFDWELSQEISSLLRKQDICMEIKIYVSVQISVH